jgi:hypothetical protein
MVLEILMFKLILRPKLSLPFFFLARNFPDFVFVALRRSRHFCGAMQNIEN